MIGYHCGVDRNGPGFDMGSKHDLGVVKFIPFHFWPPPNNEIRCYSEHTPFKIKIYRFLKVSSNKNCSMIL